MLFSEETCADGRKLITITGCSLWSSALLEIGCYTYLVVHRKEILRLNSVMFIGS